MTRPDIDRWLKYSDNCNRLLAETLNAAPHTFDAPFQTESAFKSVRQILAHMFGAEERWIKFRIQGQPLPEKFEDRAPLTVDGLFQAGAAIRAETYAYIASLPAADLGRTVELSLPAANYSGTLTIEEILFNLFTHEIYHRGQVTMALQQQGIDPPNFDYFLLRP